jgi:hypothetical protein
MVKAGSRAVCMLYLNGIGDGDEDEGEGHGHEHLDQERRDVALTEQMVLP